MGKMERCENCGGDGEIECLNCYGTGNEECYECGGKGEVEVEDEEVKEEKDD